MTKAAFNTGPTKFDLRKEQIELAYIDFISGKYTQKEIAVKYGFNESDTSRYLTYYMKLKQGRV
jgi:hypothetical protein